MDNTVIEKEVPVLDGVPSVLGKLSFGYLRGSSTIGHENIIEKKNNFKRNSYELFKPASPMLIETIKAFNNARKVSLLVPSLYISPEQAKVGYLLSRLHSVDKDTDINYKTFCANSSCEALSGAIKLARHRVSAGKKTSGVKYRQKQDRWIIFYDKNHKYRKLFNPLNRSASEAICANIHYVDSLESLYAQLPKREWMAIFCPNHAEDKLSALFEVRDYAANNDIQFIFSDTEEILKPKNLAAVDVNADITVYGENATDWQMPFGCFVMTPEAYKVWDNNSDCHAHSSTFGGNGVTVSVVLSIFEKLGYLDSKDRYMFKKIDESYDFCFETFKLYISEKGARSVDVIGLGVDVQEARGARLYMYNGRNVIDATGCFGCSLRGHNSTDLNTVLDTHDNTHDYFADLESRLHSLTGFPHAIPAVSGASAVDMAVTMALLANHKRKKVITFKGNYSGKSLISMNLSQQSPKITGGSQDAFRPYFVENIYIDPYAPSAQIELNALFDSGDIALVWFEIVQGTEVKRIPENITQLIFERKKDAGFLVGVDEVLTGMWRGSESLLLHPTLIEQADVVSLSKALSDLVFPIGAALIQDSVYQSANSFDEDLVSRLQNIYRNSLGAHFSLNAIDNIIKNNLVEQRSKNIETLLSGLREIVADSSIFESVTHQGNLIRINLTSKKFLFGDRPGMKAFLEAAVSSYILETCWVLCIVLRVNMPIFSDPRDVDDFIIRMKKGLAGLTPGKVYRHAIKTIIKKSL